MLLTSLPSSAQYIITVPAEITVQSSSAVCVFVCGIPGWLSICMLPLVVWQCFSGPLIQYDHFTVPEGKSRYSAQHTWRTRFVASLQGTYRMCWAVVVGPRCRNQAQILAADQSTSPWA